MDKEKVIKVDHSILQCLIIAHQAGRSVNLHEILCYELLIVPISLGQMDRNLCTGSNKAKLSHELTEGIECPPALDPDEFGEDATLIIHGQY